MPAYLSTMHKISALANLSDRRPARHEPAADDVREGGRIEVRRKISEKIDIFTYRKLYYLFLFVSWRHNYNGVTRNPTRQGVM